MDEFPVLYIFIYKGRTEQNISLLRLFSINYFDKGTIKEQAAINKEVPLSDSDLRRTKALFKMEFTQDGKLFGTYNNSITNPGSFIATETKGIRRIQVRSATLIN